MQMPHPAPLSWRFADRAAHLNASAIRELLKITARPDIISFAGGLPSPESFPVERLRAAYDAVLTRHGSAALQYGPTDGYAPLRAWVADSLSTPGVRIQPEQVLLVAGSQQGLDLLGKVLIDEGSKVLVETPTYLGALQAFSLYRPRFIALESDEAGLLPDQVAARGQGARLLYALPNFQNPTGRTLPLERRLALVETCARLGLPLIEDDPYAALRYRGTPLPSLFSLNPDGVVYLGSFSKVLTPGIRLGYVVAPQPLIRKMELVKQAADLHTAQLTQMVVHELVKDGFLNEHIPAIQQGYAARCHAMLEALVAAMPEGVRWSRPEGGMFLWLSLPESLDSAQLLEAALANNVAFVPGAPFYADTPARNTLRLSFATVTPEKMAEGIGTLGRLIAAHLQSAPRSVSGVCLSSA